MDAYRAAAIAAALLGGAQPAHAQTIDSSDTIDSGCVEPGATGWFRVVSGSTKQDVLVVDTDGDGLPEEAWCPGDTTPKSLTSTGTTTCGGLDTITSSNCAFQIDVWRDTAAANTNGGGYISCAGNGRPVMMFGGVGADLLEGTSGYGDFLHGGDDADGLKGLGGPDFLCPGGAGTGNQLASGGDGNDLIWGGPDVDSLEGNAGDDLVSGAPGGDEVNGNGGADSVHGDAGDDTVDGGASDDVVFGALGDDSLQGDDGNDVLIGQDLFADASVVGGAGTDTCWLDDAAGATNDDPSSTCESTVAMVPCATDLYVGTNDGTDAWLYRLDAVGDRQARARLRASGGAYADLVIGLAVDPTDCLLWVVVQDGADQKIATLASGEPSGGSTSDWDLSIVADVPGDDLVDIAFSERGHLVGLEGDADLRKIDKSTGSETQLASMGRSGSAGVHLAYDAPDSQGFFAYTSHADGFDVDQHDPVSGFNRPVENHIDWMSPLPFTVLDDGSEAGVILEIDDTVGGDGDYPMFVRGRRDWDGVAGSPVTDGRDAWTVMGSCGGGQCTADLDEPPDAITVPHFAE